MSKIKKFLDFITGYTSFNKKLDRIVNRDREVVATNPSLSTDEILDLYSLIKDYLSSVGDIPGVSIMWQKTEVGPNYVWMKSLGGYNTNNIEGLNSFRVQGTLKIDKGSDFKQIEMEIDSAKSQLESEDFILEWVRDTEIIGKAEDIINYVDVYNKLTVKHKSYKAPVQKRMRRAA
jgi:hypothetical protein